MNKDQFWNTPSQKSQSLTPCGKFKNFITSIGFSNFIGRVVFATSLLLLYPPIFNQISFAHTGAELQHMVGSGLSLFMVVLGAMLLVSNRWEYNRADLAHNQQKKWLELTVTLGALVSVASGYLFATPYLTWLGFAVIALGMLVEKVLYWVDDYLMTVELYACNRNSGNRKHEYSLLIVPKFYFILWGASLKKTACLGYVSVLISAVALCFISVFCLLEVLQSWLPHYSLSHTFMGGQSDFSIIIMFFAVTLLALFFVLAAKKTESSTNVSQKTLRLVKFHDDLYKAASQAPVYEIISNGLQQIPSRLLGCSYEIESILNLIDFFTKNPTHFQQMRAVEALGYYYI